MSHPAVENRCSLDILITAPLWCY